MTLKSAQLEYAQAESAVSTNVRNENRYAGAVRNANASARMLNDVMTTIKTSSAKNLPEATAVKLVMQDRKIKGLTTDLSIQRSETELAEIDARQKELALSNQESSYQKQLSKTESTYQEKLSAKEQALTKARETIGVQAALEKARREFSPNEAEAYQQGNNLVIRLKSVKFASGRSELPQNSLSVLAKVSDVAKELGAAKIRVEGHTDSIGGQKQNQTLSEKRANAVATYFKTSGVDGADVTAEGFGLSKPLASNKSAAGRAENRRVDVVITPEATVTE
jgi:OmpA-OmpF porin, OOP family